MIGEFCFLPESPEAYAKCHEILGLPEGVHWASLKVAFGSGEFGEVTLVLIPTGEQVRALAELAVRKIQDSCFEQSAEPEG
jgi:hypothetical protein